MTNAFQSNAFQSNAFQTAIPVTVTPPTLALILTTFAPTISIPVSVTPLTLALLITSHTPFIAVGQAVWVIPPTLALILTFYSPTVSITGLVSPPTLALILTTYAPTILTKKLLAALKYILEIHDTDGNLVSILHNAYNISFSEALNEAPLLGFSIPADDNKVADLLRDNEVWLRNYKTGATMKKFGLIHRRDIRRW